MISVSHASHRGRESGCAKQRACVGRVFIHAWFKGLKRSRPAQGAKVLETLVEPTK
jgi:hypothetical protein